jgi:hypothetical protein
MYVVVTLFLWIVLGVAFSVVNEIWFHKMTPPEWILVGTGVVFAVLALIFEFREREATKDRERADSETHLKEIAELRERLAANHAKLEAKMDVNLLLGAENVHRLQEVTHTTQEPVASSLLAAVQRIEELEHQNPYFELRINQIVAIRSNQNGCEIDVAVSIRNRGSDSRASDWYFRAHGGTLPQAIGAKAIRTAFEPEGGDLIDHPVKHNTSRQGIITFLAQGVTAEQAGQAAYAFLHCQDGRNFGWDSDIQYLERRPN